MGWHFYLALLHARQKDDLTQLTVTKGRVICFISLLQLFRLYASTTMDKKEKREKEGKENKKSARISSRTNTPENSRLYAIATKCAGEDSIICVKA